MEKILECSSRGDKRFSALYAEVTYNGRIGTIEQHYQSCKMFYNKNLVIEQKANWKDAKGEDVSVIKINGEIYSSKYLTAFYKMLWVKYLDRNPELVRYAEQFDDFNDMFRGKSINSQEDVIREYVKKGRDSILSDIEVIELKNMIQGNYAIEMIGDLLEAPVDIIGHQVNCLGIMGGGLALQVKKRYPEAYRVYADYCSQNKKDEKMLGKTQFVTIAGEILNYNSGKAKEQIVANLFGQYDIGTDAVRTKPDKLLQALKELKEFAMVHGYRVGLPYQLGSGLAGGDWDKIYKLIKFVFRDYPVFIYKLEK